MELKRRKLTLVGTMEKNKACIPPSFLLKADEGTHQYAFDHANNFTLLFVAKKTGGSSPVDYSIRKKRDTVYWKRINKRILQPEKMWCGQS
jgi:hypothetical protein